MLLKQHLDMIGRNEPVQRKARFWQSYVRALKDEPQYLAEDEWDAHARRLEAIDELLPLKYRYPHYYRPSSARSASVPPPPRSASVPPTTLRALSRARSTTPAPPHLRDIVEEKPSSLYSYSGQKLNESSFDSSFSKAVTSYSKSSSSSSSNTITKRTTSYIPIRSTRINSEIIHAYLGRNDVYNWPDDEFPGEPLYHRPYYGSYVRRPLAELLEPSYHLPRSRITRDPWWYDYPSLKPYSPYNRYPYTSLRYPYSHVSSPYVSRWYYSPYYLRDSYLSPIKRTYLWNYHPIRPFCK
ncbi:uncharacterized protein LOC128987657 isoform X2 [Macrosteles quadrilineatus]|uniref:uncharacterized protein LOC128987657 isoform X2 n=1 Tax=Macrosteles quadrilineatus TaxID=74068 RepID=UPI0023E111CC|nr:uncharacterized protein LOC128987657 isoform X2 [Macrosteles quadrilineatus]